MGLLMIENASDVHVKLKNELVTITLGSYNYICFTILERLLDSAAKYKPISVQFTMNSLVLLLYVSFVLLVYV
ncbi:hypothetical protein Q1695_010249 [Nippostrongylus brasiliensis]|nr:hypothetical protein Q1695_010249 [Nippostrongylus brasiliensis]